MIENWDQYKNLEYYPDRVCGCGCEEKIRVKSYHKYHGIPKYVNGHNRKGKVGKPRLDIRGENNPTKRLEVRKKLSEAKKGKTYEEIYGDKAESMKKNLRAKIAGHHFQTKESREKIGRASIQHWKDPEFREKMSKERRNRKLSEAHKKSIARKNSETMKKKWKDPEYREKQLDIVLEAMRKGRKIKPNKPEKFLTKLLQKLFPSQWKYVGDWSFVIERKNPDFISIKGGKKIIEIFGDYWHGKKRTKKNKKRVERERINLFAKYGYQTLIIWEKELKDKEKLRNKLVEFNDDK